MVDVLSGGRLEFGVGRGSQRYEYERLGVPLDEKGVRFEEAMAVIRQAWTEEAFAFEGTYYRCNMNFAGVLDHRQVLHSMQLFATSVMPQLA